MSDHPETVETKYVVRRLSEEKAGIIEIEVEIVPREPDEPVVSKEVATLVLNQARNDPERRLIRQSISRLNKKRK